jgi:lysophospholipase L1-like esterase
VDPATARASVDDPSATRGRRYRCAVFGRLLLVLACLLAVTSAGPASGSSEPRRSHAAARYYVALGDSLAAGTQPGMLFSREGYADQLLRLERGRFPGLVLRKLACPGDTSTAFRRGGRCPYPRKTQLAEATAFLRAHRGRIAFVTLDIGANDYLRCRTEQLSCAAGAFNGVRKNVPPIVRALRAAAGPRVPIVGMEYYAPLLAQWLDGTAGQAEASAHVGFVSAGNALLRRLYRGSGARVARVEAAFATKNFTARETLPGGRSVPRNVARICRLTWMCSKGNIHPNQEGYGVIARAFAAALR